MSARDVWVSKDDSSDIVRAESIAGVGRDYNGNVTARLAGGEGAAVTLADPGAHDGSPTPRDFHRQLTCQCIDGMVPQGFSRHQALRDRA